MKFLRDINGVSINFSKSILFVPLFPKPMPFSSSPPPPSAPHSTVDVASAAVSILKHNRSKSRWSHLRSLIAAAGIDHRLTAAQFTQIALQLRNSPHLVIRFFHFTLHHSLSSHSLSSYATVIHILSRSRQKSQALTLIKSAMCAFSETHQTTSIQIFDALIKTYRACDSAPFVFDLLVKACLESQKIDIAIEIYATLKLKNVHLKTSTLNSLIEIVSKNRGSFAGYNLYREIFNLDDDDNAGRNMKLNKGVFPNANTLNVVMIGFYREGLLDKVEEVWEEFSRVACVPNIYSFNVLMAAHCDNGRMDEAMRVWENIDNEGLKRDAVAYNTLIGGFCRLGEVEKAEEIYREMAMSCVESTCITYEHLISGYCKIGDLDSGMLLYNDMCRKEFSPENSTVNVVVRSFCEKGLISDALVFWRMIVKKCDAVLEKENYVKLIKGLCDDGKFEEALNIQAEMVVEGFKPDLEIYGAFIDGYVKQGNETMADKLREEMICISR